MKPKNRCWKSSRKLMNAALSVSVALALSACTKAQLIGTKQLKSLKLFTVLSVAPPSGPKAGGTTISIVGTGFVSGMTIAIDGIPCTSVQVYNSISASCVTGASATEGPFAVTIVNGDGASDVGHTFAYLGAIRATVTKIAAGGNLMSTGGSGANRVTARATTIGAIVHHGDGTTGNSATGGTGSNQITVLGGAVGVFSKH